MKKYFHIIISFALCVLFSFVFASPAPVKIPADMHGIYRNVKDRFAFLKVEDERVTLFNCSDQRIISINANKKQPSAECFHFVYEESAGYHEGSIARKYEEAKIVLCAVKTGSRLNFYEGQTKLKAGKIAEFSVLEPFFNFFGELSFDKIGDVKFQINQKGDDCKEER